MRLHTRHGNYHQQCAQIASNLDVEIGVLFALQIYYEISTLCTSVLMKDNNVVVHGRTMDWDMKELKALSVPISIYWKGSCVGVAMQWVGCVGFYTAMRHNSFSITINYRRLKDEYARANEVVKEHLGWMDCVVPAINKRMGLGDAGIVDTIKHYVGDTGLYYMAHLLQFTSASVVPASFLLREAIIKDKTYAAALRRLTRTPTITPVFFTLAGKKTGAVLAKDGSRVVVRKLDKQNPRLIIQPNMDWFGSSPVDIMKSKKRVKDLKTYLNKKGHTKTHLWDAMSSKIKSVCNDITVYTTLFVPTTNEFQYKVHP